MFVGVDIRSDSIRAVAVNDQGDITDRTTKPGSTHDVLAEVVRTIAQGQAERVGLAGRAGEPVAERVAAAARVSVWVATAIVTTGTAIALGEQWLGAARGFRHVASLSIDDHVHAGIVINGGPFNGARGLAGDASWLALNPVERDDYRRMGCLEAEISGSGIARRLVWRVKTGDPSRAVDLAGGEMNAVTAIHVFEAARAGDGVAVSVARDTARYVGMAIANMVAVMDPEIVVLGGAIASAPDLLVEPARAEAIRRMSPAATADPRSSPRLVLAQLGEDAAALGAARAAMLHE